jgi:CheY-like chemotaxis protein
MTSRLAEMSAASHDRQAFGGKRPTEVSYVLVADADPSRTAACVESIKPFNIGVLVARDGDEAIGILHRFGPPVLLIADLSLPGKDGFAVIDALREIDGGRTEIIAWSGMRELREFAVHRLAGLNVRVLSASASPAVLRGAVDRALRSGGSARAESAARSGVDEIHRTMSALSDRARRLSGAAGVAVYLKAPGQSQFRAMVTWTADAPVPDSPPHIPRVVDEVLETGEPLVLPDLSAHTSSGAGRSLAPEAIRGLIAVPLKAEEGEVIGAVCMFDVKPLAIGEEDLESLKALGGGAERPPMARERTAADERSGPVGEIDEGRQPRPEPAEPVRQPSVALLDRRSGDHAIARELARVRREQRQLSVILFDVDLATSGPEGSAPEDPIDLVSDTLVKAIRGSDLAIEWNRGELLVVFPGLNGAEARQVAERVRAAMQAGARHRVSVSGGVAELLANETVESAVARAHEKVRLARERGHNRVG